MYTIQTLRNSFYTKLFGRQYKIDEIDGQAEMSDRLPFKGLDK